ncbi:MAG TPA: hypothetical protein VGK74_22230 [Symbiobacteriaceae bacterium]|jgi:hypothetical protein
MLNPTLTTRTAVIDCANAAAQTLPEPAAAILGAEIQDQNAANGAVLPDTALAVVVAAPQAGQIQFTGTASAPSRTVTLAAAPAAHTVLFVRFVPQGAIPAAL